MPLLHYAVISAYVQSSVVKSQVSLTAMLSMIFAMLFYAPGHTALITSCTSASLVPFLCLIVPAGRPAFLLHQYEPWAFEDNRFTLNGLVLE